MGIYGGRKAVNDVHIIHPKFPFLTRFISLCSFCLTEMLGCSSSHPCLRCRCQRLSHPAPVWLNRNIINAVSGQDFSDRDHNPGCPGSPWRLLIHCGVQPGLLGCAPALLTTIMAQMNFPPTHTTCAIHPSHQTGLKARKLFICRQFIFTVPFWKIQSNA